jgi:hypothetical protein
VAEPRVERRRAANSAAGRRGSGCHETDASRMASVRGGSLQLQTGPDQKIVHLRIVLGAGIA